MRISYDELLKLYVEQKLSVYEISKITGYKNPTIYWYMNKYNIVRRSRSLAGEISWEKGISKVTKRMVNANLKNIRKAREGRTKESFKKQSEVMLKKYDEGLRPWNFRDGAQSETNRRVRRPRWKKLVGEIRKRDNYTCQKCGAKNIILQVHHIDKDGYNDDPKNLITLCCSCHRKEHVFKNLISKEKLEQLYLVDKLSIRKISKKTNICVSSIKNYLDRYGIKTRNMSKARKNYFNSL